MKLPTSLVLLYVSCVAVDIAANPAAVDIAANPVAVDIAANSVVIDIAANPDDDASKYHKDAGTNKVIGGRTDAGEWENYSVHVNKNHRKDQRQRRAFSPFLLAWRKILKTTLGSKQYSFIGIRKKTFVKIGTLNNAVDDFYSLGPTRIQQEQGSLNGFAGNQVIRLETAIVHDRELPILYVLSGKSARVVYDNPSPNNIERGILYAENMAWAKSLLRAVQTAFK